MERGKASASLLLATGVVVAMALVAALAYFGLRSRPEVAERRDAESSAAALESQALSVDPAEPAPVASAVDPSLATSREAAAVAAAPVDSVADENRETEVRGRVVDPSGAPIEGATVYAARDSDRRGVPLDARPWADRRSEAKTGADGRFSFEGIKSGRLCLAVRAKGFGPFDSDAWRVPPELVLDVGDLRLAPGVRLDGRVVDSRGAPVAGALLIRPEDERALASDSEPLDVGPLVATSDASGAFAIDVQACGPWILLVRHAEHQDLVARGAVDAPGGTGHVVLRMEDGGSIEGHVLGPARNGGLWSVRTRLDAPDEADVAARFAREVRCDASGAFRIEGLLAEKVYSLRAHVTEADGDVGDSAGDAVRAFAGDLDVEIAVPTPFELIARVVDASTGESIAKSEAVVELTDLGRGGRFAVTGKSVDGGETRFVCDAALPSAQPRARARVTLRAERYGSVHFEHLSVAYGERVPLGNVALERLGVVRLRAVDAEAGTPLSEAKAQCKANWDDERGIASDRSEGDGVIELFAAAGTRGTATVSHRERGTSPPLDVVFTSGDAPPIDVPLSLAGSLDLVVEVVDSLGAFVPRVDVVLTYTPNGPPSPDRQQPPARHTGITDAEGKCKFADLADGWYEVVAKLERAGVPLDEAAAAARKQSFQSGGDKTVVVRLQVPAAVRLDGRVSENQAPLAGATVAALPFERVRMGDLRARSRDALITARTGADGRYEIADLGEGHWTLVVTHPLRAAPAIVPCTLRAPDERVDVALTACGVEGIATERDGTPIAGVRVRLEMREPSRDDRERIVPYPLGGPPFVTDDSGAFALRGLPVDLPFVLSFRHPDYVLAYRDVSPLRANELRAGFDVKLERAGRIEVELISLAGNAARVLVVVQRLDPKTGQPRGPRVGPVRTDPRGRAVIGGLAPGKWRVLVLRRGAEPLPRDVEVRAGKASEVTIDVD